MSTTTIDHPFQSKAIIGDVIVGKEIDKNLMLRRVNFWRKIVWATKFAEFAIGYVVRALFDLKIIVIAAIFFTGFFQIEMRER